MKEQNSGASIEMPKYRSHKEVWALKIADIMNEMDGSGTIIPADGRCASLHVSKEYMHKHMPKIGGYYVQYEDGYQSWSPADAFEEGNTLIDGVCEIAKIPISNGISFDSENRRISLDRAVTMNIGSGKINPDELLADAEKIFLYLSK